jgi:hypothetical protein
MKIMNHYGGERIKFMKEIFERVKSDAILQEEIFIGPGIRQWTCDTRDN